MCTGKANVVAPLTSPEEPPATSYAASPSFPLYVSLLHGSRKLVAELKTGAGPGLRRA